MEQTGNISLWLILSELTEEVKNGNLPPYYSSGSPYVLICDNFERLYVPFQLSGQHKIWNLPKKHAKKALPGLKKLPKLKKLEIRRNEYEIYESYCSASVNEMETSSLFENEYDNEEDMIQQAILASLNIH